METIQKARELYTTKKSHNNHSSHLRNDNKQERKLDDDIHRYISIAVKSIPSANLFHNSCIFDSLYSALLVCVKHDDGVLPLARAYKSLEKYFFLLVQQPWKPEYKTLKTYGGFYKTKIKAVLSKAELIFMSAGYVMGHNNTMVYQNAEVDMPKLLILSFDCFVAGGICERIAERHNQLKTVGGTLNDAIFDILQTSWPKDSAKEKFIIMENKSSSRLTEPPELPKREPVINGSSIKKMTNKTVLYPQEPPQVYDVNIRTQGLEESLGNFKYKSNTDPHFSFIDEPEAAEHYPKLSQATPEEHMRESLKLVKEQDSEKNWKYIPDVLSSSSSHHSSSVTYPPGVYTQMPHLTPDSNRMVDEGMGSGITLPPKSPFTSQVPPNPNLSVFPKSVYSDQGYSTGLIQPSSVDLTSDTIYRPPPAIKSAMNIIHPGSAPPPVNRHLKPINANEDVVDGPVMVKYDNNGTPIPPTKAAFLPQTHDSHPQIGALNIGNGNDLRPPRSLHQMKSRSLKTESKKLVADTRVSKSMDYSRDLWKAQEEPKRSCLMCTLDNDWRSTTCDACGEALPEELTYR